MNIDLDNKELVMDMDIGHGMDVDVDRTLTPAMYTYHGLDTAMDMDIGHL
jgi:hypothetical protein